jgi:hypothetical protein
MDDTKTPDATMADVHGSSVSFPVQLATIPIPLGHPGQWVLRNKRVVDKVYQEPPQKTEQKQTGEQREQARLQELAEVKAWVAQRTEEKKVTSLFDKFEAWRFAEGGGQGEPSPLCSVPTMRC